MSRRKQATTDIITDIPELEEGQRFARVLGSRGKNIHEVQFSNSEEGILVNLPPKFRSLVWVKRGSYVIIEPAEEEEKSKVAGDISAVLFPDHIKHYKQQGIWPFKDQLSKSNINQQQSSDVSDNDIDDNEDDDEDDGLFVNNNRPVMEDTESESESESDEESEEEKQAK
ncbi:hypothetical protein BG004_002450 [Podila humilis]|nr:hypothetical protein BG004_002450 [Podila humilis]